MLFRSCAKSIIQNGISKVITYVPDRDGEGFNWDITTEMFKEAGVMLHMKERKNAE